jgi:hypothetical protein
MITYRNKKDGWWVLKDILTNRQEFKNTTGNFRGLSYTLGTGILPESWAKAFKAANVDYVIYSYSTPIAWLANGKWITPDVNYSITTKQHQNKTNTAISQL